MTCSKYYHSVFRTFLPKLSDCDTDDDVAMCFLKSKEGFEKYLLYLVGQGQAESAISDKTVHHFFKVVQSTSGPNDLPSKFRRIICHCAAEFVSLFQGLLSDSCCHMKFFSIHKCVSH